MKFVAAIIFAMVLFLTPGSGFAQTAAVTGATTAVATEQKPCMVEAVIDGAIGPASLDFLTRASQRATQNKCGSILLLINTPGGNLQTTRLIVEQILNSQIPVMCLIYPSGAHAGSAGAIIMQACHLAGAMEATNIGAATPISGSGEKISDDLRKKLLNDTRSWVEGLAKLRGRSELFAKEIIEDAKAVAASEALKLKAIDYVATSKEDFLKFADNKSVRISETLTAQITIGETIVMVQDLRYRVMDVLMNPQVAYLMFMGSLGLLYFELTHPGMIAPGVIGGVGLLISLISLHMLDVTWGAVLLILAGIGFMVAEAFVAGFGILGVGGVVAFFMGSLFLFDVEQTGLVLPLSTILPTSLLIGSLMIGVAYLAFSSRNRRPRGGYDDLLGESAQVSDVQPGDGKFGFVEVQGETWRATSDQPLVVGDLVQIDKHEGLTLHVSKKIINKETV